MGNENRKTVRIGVFVPASCQLLDLACVDVLNCMGHEYLTGLRMLPASLTDLAPDVHVSYIGSTAAGSTVDLTAGARLTVTHRLDDEAAVGPGRLDVVIVPGPDPFGGDNGGGTGTDARALDWLRRQAAHPGTDVLSVCTGIFLCGEAGLLRGRTAAGPRGLQDLVRERFEGVTLVGDRLRWVQDGNLWSSGGITNGNDLVAAYARKSRHFPGPVAEMAIRMCEVGERPQKYEQGNAAFTAGILWQMVKAWFMGLGKTKTT